MNLKEYINIFLKYKMSSAPKKAQINRIQQQPIITKEEPIPFLVYNSSTRSI